MSSPKPVEPAERALLLYDGLCGFCNGAVQWLLKRDRRDRFRFAAQQSRPAQDILRRHGITGEASSVYLVENFDTPAERLWLHSDVTVHSLVALGGFWRLLGRCLKLVPKFLRDAAYGLIARNRYLLAGRYDVCPVPTAAERSKFLGI